jgi:imidazolonepropionase-like amidohydrolase
MERTTGSIDVGKVADAVLLDANPVEDIASTTRIRAVISAGRLYDRAALDRILAEVADQARSH